MLYAAGAESITNKMVGLDEELPLQAMFTRRITAYQTSVSFAIEPLYSLRSEREFYAPK